MILFGRALARALGQIVQAPGPHAMSALALGLTCFLAGAFGLFLSNLDRHLTDKLGHARFQVFWKPGSDMTQVSAQWQAIRSFPGVEGFHSFTPAEALENLKRTLGEGQDYSWVSSQAGGQAGAALPLPPTAMASLRVDSGDMRPYQAVLERVKALPGVDKVSLSPMQLDVATAIRALSFKALLPLSLSLSLAVAVVSYLAARLCLESRRAEVETLRLVGAREWFVRLPWAVSAGLTGLAGCLAGLGGLWALQAGLSDALYEAPLWIAIGPLPLEEACAMALMALGMSALGGWLAARP